MSLPGNKMLEILEEVQARTSWKIWIKKDSILFNLQAKYGSCFDRDHANDVYEMITKRVIKEKQEKEKDNI